jgi:two-component system, NarL family, nitrate/nitrite response regulator NarL
VSSPPPISIVLAVAVRLYREGLATALRGFAQFKLQGIAGTSLEARIAVERYRPAVAIVDVSLDEVMTLMRDVSTQCSGTHIIAFAVREDIRSILSYAEAGADGFFTATGSMNELVEAIERTAAGELLCSPRIAAELLRRAAHQAHPDPADATHSPLTGREQQVLALIRQGQSNKEIGSALNIAEATVKNHVHHVLEKLQVPTRAQAIAADMDRIKGCFESRRSSRRAS